LPSKPISQLGTGGPNDHYPLDHYQLEPEKEIICPKDLGPTNKEEALFIVNQGD